MSWIELTMRAEDELTGARAHGLINTAFHLDGFVGGAGKSRATFAEPLLTRANGGYWRLIYQKELQGKHKEPTGQSRPRRYTRVMRVTGYGRHVRIICREYEWHTDGYKASRKRKEDIKRGLYNLEELGPLV